MLSQIYLNCRIWLDGLARHQERRGSDHRDAFRFSISESLVVHYNRSQDHPKNLGLLIQGTLKWKRKFTACEINRLYMLNNGFRSWKTPTGWTELTATEAADSSRPTKRIKKGHPGFTKPRILSGLSQSLLFVTCNTVIFGRISLMECKENATWTRIQTLTEAK